AKVMDFGLAKTQKTNEKHLTKTGTTLGTLAYMSPEQARGEALDQRSDIFSFAIVLYELFTGKLPFVSEYEPAGILYAIMQEEPEPFAQVNPYLPENLEAIVFKALKKDKEERYQSTDELIKDLQGIEMGSGES
ncbi:protein kinase, partial [candidate division KSB1 bacterium]|nr:protein kinase [candidate division KSB1 bacterium]